MTNSPFASVRAVAFDLDGTLIDSLPDLADSANVGSYLKAEERYQSSSGKD